MAGTGIPLVGGVPERYSGNKTHFQIKCKSAAEEAAFDLKQLRTGPRCGIVESIANLAKGALGGGILAGHVAYKTSGVVSGIGLNIFYGLYLCFNFYLLVKCAQVLCKRTHTASMTYPDVGECAVGLFPNPKVAKWSKCYRIWIDFITCVNLFGSCTCYQLMVAKSIKQLAENTQKEMEGPGYINLRIYVLIMIIPTVLICLITTMKYLAPFSLAANAVIGACIILTVAYAFEYNPTFSNMVTFTSLYDQIVFTGMSVFSMSCAGVVIPVENAMRNPEKIHIVMGVGYIFIISAVFFASFFGYAAFLSHSESPLPVNFPLTSILAKVMKVLLALMIYVTHAVNFFMPFNCVFFYIKKRIAPEKWFRVELICRAVIVVIVGLVGVVFPAVNSLISLLGCFCITNMAIICPNTIYVLINYERPGLGKYKWRLWRSIGLSILGIFIMICGTIINVNELISDFFEDEETPKVTSTTPGKL